MSTLSAVLEAAGDAPALISTFVALETALDAALPVTRKLIGDIEAEIPAIGQELKADASALSSAVEQDAGAALKNVVDSAQALVTEVKTLFAKYAQVAAKTAAAPAT